MKKKMEQLEFYDFFGNILKAYEKINEEFCNEEKIKEKWKSLEGVVECGKFYEISNTGKVWSIRNKKVLKPMKDRKGYLIVCLSENGKCKNYKVHRLVALAFIPNTYNLPQINHIDENKENNYISNLEWCDCKYNNNYGNRNQKASLSMIGKNKGKKRSQETKEKMSKSKIGKKQSQKTISKRVKKCKKAVIAYTYPNMQFVGIFDSLKQASEILVIDASGISKVLHGKRRQHKGYFFQYENEQNITEMENDVK